MLSRNISTDIIQYLQNKKGKSVDDIAQAMGTSPKHIQNIIDKKALLEKENIDIYLKNTNIQFWQFALEHIQMKHLPEKVKKRIFLCKKIYDKIKNKKT